MYIISKITNWLIRRNATNSDVDRSHNGEQQRQQQEEIIMRDMNMQSNTPIWEEQKRVKVPVSIVSDSNDKSFKFDNLLTIKTNQNQALIAWASRTYNVMFRDGPPLGIAPNSPLPHKESAALAMMLAIRDCSRAKMTFEEIDALFVDTLSTFK